jgi:hypothetical protein
MKQRMRITMVVFLAALGITIAVASPSGHSQPSSKHGAIGTPLRPKGQHASPTVGTALRQTYWAVVKANGALLGRSPGVTGAARSGTGDYTVSFAVQVRKCAWLATNRLLAKHSEEPFAGNAATETPAALNKVEVITFTEAATFVLRDSTFSLAIVC